MSDSERYAHIVEEDVHPYQALCGWEWNGTQLGPEPPVCPKCLALYEGVTDPKELVR